MNNASAALLALVMVCSLPAMALAAADPGHTASMDDETNLEATTQAGNDFLELENTTNRQLLDPDAAGERSIVTLRHELATAVSTADSELRTDYDRFAFEEAFDAHPEERETLIEDRFETLRADALELSAVEADAVEAHATGEMTDREFLRELLVVTETAAQLEEQALELESDAATVPGYTATEASDERRAISNKLDTQQSQLRAELLGQMTTDEPTPVLLETTADGYRLSMVSGQNYHSEVVRFDHRDLEGDDQIGSAAAVSDYAGERYPYAMSTSGNFEFSSIDSAHLYTAEFDHAQGTLLAFIDGATGEVTREHQQLTVGDLPIKAQESWEEDGVELTLNQTTASGPAELTVTDATTGEAVEATVLLDDGELTETDEDGSLWIAQPIGAYDLTVETDETSVTVEPSRDG